MKARTIASAVAAVALILASVGTTSALADAAVTAGSGSQADPYIVTSRGDVPEGATTYSSSTDPLTCQPTTLYSAVTPGTPGVPAKDAVTHEEYQWSQTTTIYTVEHKQVKYTGHDSAVLLWLNAHGTSVGTSVWQLSDKTVNDAGVNPLAPGIFYDGAFSSSHEVSLSAYGGPNVSVQYTITGIDISLTPPSGSFVKSSKDETVYYVHGGSPSASLSDANWTTDSPAGWTKVHERTITDHAAVPAVPATDPVTTWYSFTDTSQSCPSVVIVPPTFKPATCLGPSELDLASEPTGVKYALLSDGVTRPAAGVWPLAAGESVTIVIHTIAGYAPASFTQTYTGQAQENDLSCYDPIGCVSTGITSSEDNAPSATPDGEYYEGTGPGGSAVDQYQTTTGNLQGLGVQTIAFKNVAGYQPSFTIVFDRNTSGPGTGYANLVAEWYMNGSSPDTDGTFTIDPATTLLWTNKIASGAGSQGDPQLLSFFENQWPANTLISMGAHLGSANPTTTHSTVTDITGCVSQSAPVKPASLTRSAVTDGTPDCTNDTVEETTTNYETDYIWDAGTASYVLGSEYVASTSDVSVTLTGEVLATDCPPTSTPTATPTPTSTPVVHTTTVTQKKLGFTGDTTNFGVGLATFAGLLVLGFIAFIIGRRRAARRN